MVREFISCTSEIIYEGEYLNGEKSGKGKEYDIYGRVIFEGDYLKGKRNGKGKEYVFLHKPDIYTDEEFEEMKNHPLLGKKLLNGKGFDARVLSATLQHHERSDGSGYPRGLDDDEIDDFAAIVAIADVYDAMTSARAHRDPLCSFQVIAEFEKEGLHKFRTKFVLTFLEHIANTYNNSRVMLNDAKTGRVVYINKSNLSRPVIQLDSGDIINLADSIYSDIYIKSIL